MLWCVDLDVFSLFFFWGVGWGGMGCLHYGREAIVAGFLKSSIEYRGRVGEIEKALDVGSMGGGSSSSSSPSSCSSTGTLVKTSDSEESPETRSM